jgi:hypothetical protein
MGESPVLKLPGFLPVSAVRAVEVVPQISQNCQKQEWLNHAGLNPFLAKFA